MEQNLTVMQGAFDSPALGKFVYCSSTTYVRMIQCTQAGTVDTADRANQCNLATNAMIFLIFFNTLDGTLSHLVGCCCCMGYYQLKPRQS